MSEEKKRKAKKIKNMKPAELETAIEKTIKEQGGLMSAYGKALWKRKTQLSKTKS